MESRVKGCIGQRLAKIWKRIASIGTKLENKENRGLYKDVLNEKVRMLKGNNHFSDK